MSFFPSIIPICFYFYFFVHLLFIGVTIPDLTHGEFKYTTSESGVTLTWISIPETPPLIQMYFIISTQRLGRLHSFSVTSRQRESRVCVSFPVHSCVGPPSVNVRSFSREWSLKLTVVELVLEDRRS